MKENEKLKKKRKKFKKMEKKKYEKKAMDLAYMCVKPQMRLYVCQALPLPNTKCVYMCVTKCVYMCVTKCVYMCHQMRLYVCHQMRLLNPQHNGARFARLPLLASLARFLTV